MKLLFGVLTTVALVAMVVSLIRPALILPKDKNPTRLKAFGSSTVAFVLVLVLSAIALPSQDPPAVAEVAAPAPVVTAEVQPVAAEVAPGVGMTLLSATRMFDELGIPTAQGDDIDGRINFSGQAPPTLVQVLGPPKDVSRITMMATGLGDESNVMLNLLRMAAVLGKVFPNWDGNQRTAWLGEAIGVGGGEILMDGRLVVVTVDRDLAMATMSITRG